MTVEEIEETLDKIDNLMKNNLNTWNEIEDKEVLNKISILVYKAQHGMIEAKDDVSEFLQRRFDVTVSPFLDQKNYENIQAYYDWINNAKKATNPKNWNYRFAKESLKIAERSGHILDEKLRNIIYDKELPDSSGLPKKITFFDKVKAKISSFFNRNKDQENDKKQEETNIDYKWKEQEQSQETEVKAPTKIKRRENPWKESYSQENFKSEAPIMPDIVVVSDLHGNIDKWNCVKQSLKDNPKRKLIIEGDAMDRGQYGVEILMQIKELCDEGRAEYMPGNHDVFAYNTLVTRGTEYENKLTGKLAKARWDRNGGKVTQAKFSDEFFSSIVEEELKNGNIKNRIDKNTLINWLGNCPIQKKLNENGVNYALGHAVFDEKLYNYDPEFNLRKALIMELSGNQQYQETLNEFNNVMWYREEDKNTHYAPLSWPKDNMVIVGHTKQKEANIKNIEGDPEKPAIFLDCGKGLLQGFNLTTREHVQLERPIQDKEMTK